MDGRRTSNAASTASTTNSTTTTPRDTRRTSNPRNGTSSIVRKFSDTSHSSVKSTSSAASVSVSSSHNGSAHDKDRTLTSFPPLPASAENSPHAALKKSNLPALGGAPFASPSLQVTSKRARPTPTTRLVPASLERLFEPADSADAKSRDALFDDQAAQGVRYTPGTLHHQSTANIEHLIQRVGAVQLVKQLSEDLAQRDARVTVLQRRAEERERLLRRMLQECEVSNLDIENRIRESERERKAREESGILSPGLLDPGSHNTLAGADTPGSINDQMSEALGDDIGTGLESTSVQRSRQGSAGSAQISVRSSDDAKPKAATGRGWKGYFKYDSGESSSKGTSAKSTDTGTIKKRPQQRPSPGERSPSATASLQDHLLSANKPNDNANADTDSAASSTSVASWAMKFIGARPAAQADPTKKHLAREKAASISGDMSRTDMSRAASQGREDPRKSGAVASDQSTHKRGGSFATQLRNTAAASLPLPSSPPDNEGMHITNLGPVEMETIVSDDDRPPTLIEGTAAHGYLTDRFGFIYDQRRRKRQNEAAAIIQQQRASIGETLDTTVKSLNAHLDADDATSIVSRASETSLASRPDSPFSAPDTDGQKGWSDYLKIFNMKGELLSHMPAAAPTTSITTADFDVDLTNTKAPNIVVAKRASEPALASITASATNSTQENAETSLAAPQDTPQNPSSPSPDPVQTLLTQLTEVHDKLQRERTGRWNEFLKRVRAERTRAGDAPGNRDRRAKGLAIMPETFLGDGEIIGVAGLGNRGKVGRAKWNEFRSLVLAGIPVAYRAKIWAECSGASELRQPGYYEELVQSQDDKHDPSVAQQIQMDIHRTLTDNVFFRVGQGVTRLNEVLLAYARRNPDVGYCQGMNLIAANLLLIMPSAEDAFWVLCSMIENILPAKYFDHSLLTSRADQVVLRGYVTELLPQLSSHLESLNIDLEAFTFQWFLSVFTDCLSAEALFRVWDVVLCVNDGATFLFQVGLALLKLNEKQLLASTGPAEVYAYISQQMTDHAISIDGLIRASEGLRKVVKREDVVRRREEAVDRELEAVRARDALRKGKGKARAEALEAFPLDDTPPDSSAEEDQQQQKKKQRPASPPMARAYRPSRQPSTVSSAATNENSNLDEDDAFRYQEPLTLRTPMPVDDEGGWMA